MLRYDYGFYKTREAAELALEDMYATGEVCEGERPRIEPPRRSGGKSKAIGSGMWRITVGDDWS